MMSVCGAAINGMGPPVDAAKAASGPFNSRMGDELGKANGGPPDAPFECRGRGLLSASPVFIVCVQPLVVSAASSAESLSVPR